ncbi:MAG TPA: hypothetical protein VIK60_05945 [Vicinamibacterales bacterium]
MPQISLSDKDAIMLRELLDAKLVELRREISHTDSPRFRDTLYEVEGMLGRVLAQLPKDVTAGSVPEA